jgi:SAM-dependent methyltransferase
MNFDPLHSLNPLNRFSDRVSDYVKFRPNYPGAVIDQIFEELEINSQFIATDIGAGTGISSRLLGARNIKVIAIEPNKAMREAADPHPLVEYRDGSAENTQLPNNSIDLITCFQAFHWFNPEPTLQEFHRILKPKGILALVWNNRDKEDIFTNEYSKIVKAVSQNHPAESRMNQLEPLINTPYFKNLREYTFENIQELDFDGLMGRAMSSSYIPREGEGFEQIVSNLQELYQQFKNDRGFVYMVYSTSLHIVEAIP